MGSAEANHINIAGIVTYLQHLTLITLFEL